MTSTAFNLQRVIPGDTRRIQDIARVVGVLESLSENKSWNVAIEEVKSKRSEQQNRYLFGCCYALMSDHSGIEKDELHDHCLKRHFGTKEKKVPVSGEHPSGYKKVPIRTTTTDESGRRSVLGKMVFAEFVESVRRVAAFMGVVIPDPEPSLVRDEPNRKAA
jgi:hypothetical protein